MARFLTLVALVLQTTSCVAADAPPLFVASTVDGQPLSGSLERLDEGWNLRLGTQDIKASGWISLRRQDRSIPPYPTDSHIVLTNGDRIRVLPTSLSLQRDRLTFRSPSLGDGKPVTVNLSAIALIWRSAPEEIDDVFAFTRGLLTTKRRGDTILLRNDDRIEGVLTRLDSDKLELDSQKKRVKIDLPQVCAIVPSGDLAFPLLVKGPSGRLTSTDGSRLTVKSIRLEGATLRGTTVLGHSFALDRSELVRLDLRDEKYFPVTFLKPIKYQHTPYLGVPWLLGINSTSAGTALILGGSVYDRGFGMHSTSRVSFALPPGVRIFETSVGLDDVVGKGGNARVRVLVDGKEMDLGLMNDLKPGVVHPIRVDIKGARELTLCVDFGAFGDVGDHVNWVDPRLVR